MTPEGYEAIKKIAKKDNYYWVSPEPTEGQDLPFVTVGSNERGSYVCVLSPADVLNGLAEAGLLHKERNQDHSSDAPSLELIPGSITAHSMTFVDRQSPAAADLLV
jgi:hypothetical protein